MQNRISIIGLAYDQKSSFLRGTALAPPLIRACLHSSMSNSYSENMQSIHHTDITDQGDFSISKYEEIGEIIDTHLKFSRLFTLGGDHSITYPIVKAYHKYYGKIQILHIDAHPDLYDEFEGDRHSHACPFARIMEEKLADRLIQVGIRALNPHQREQAKRFGVEMMEMKDYDFSKMPQPSAPIYLSIDLDAIDPAFAPGVSHQEAGGLSSREVIKIIQNINVPIIGADLVEYNPTRDVSSITAALAAKLTKEVLSKMIIEDK